MFCLWLLCPKMAALTSGDITLRLCQDCMASRAWNTIWPFPQKVCRPLIDPKSIHCAKIKGEGGIWRISLKRNRINLACKERCPCQAEFSAPELGEEHPPAIETCQGSWLPGAPSSWASLGTDRSWGLFGVGIKESLQSALFSLPADAAEAAWCWRRALGQVHLGFQGSFW